MPRTLEKTVYKFDELSDDAKEKARDWYREGALDYEWHDCTIEDAEACGAILGIEVDRVYFSGFASQGDGACFEGSYSYAKGAAKKIRDHAPDDAELHRIAAGLQALQRPALYRLAASVKHTGHYYHSRSVSISVDGTDKAETEEALGELLRDFMDWVYRRLENEHDWMLADAQCDDSIRANGYEFDESGRRAVA